LELYQHQPASLIAHRWQSKLAVSKPRDDSTPSWKFFRNYAPGLDKILSASFLFEGEEDSSLIAAEIIEREKLAKLTLLGNVDKIRTRLRTLGITLGSSALLDPAGSGKLKPYAQRLYERRRSRGMTEPEALQTARLPRIFADLMVAAGDADGSVGGALTTTADTVRAALWTLGLAPGFSLVSSFFLMVSPQKNIGADGACLFADCAVVPQPSPAQLAEIALATAENARALLEVEPRVAMLSFSTKGNAGHPTAAAVREATKTLCARAPHLIADGELQLDAAVVPEIAAQSSGVGGERACQCFHLPRAQLRQHRLQTRRAFRRLHRRRSHPAGPLATRERPLARRERRGHRERGRITAIQAASLKAQEAIRM